MMVNLDRILVSTEWEARFPRCFAWCKTRIGSDHWPVMLDTGERSSNKGKFFYFEKQWLLEEDFIDKFVQNWQVVRCRFSENRYSMDIWHGCLSMARLFSGVWLLTNLERQGRSNKIFLAD
jgi:hypothetical protein